MSSRVKSLAIAAAAVFSIVGLSAPAQAAPKHDEPQNTKWADWESEPQFSKWADWE